MVNVAILGFGTVGSGVAEVLEKNHTGIAARAAEEIQVKYIVDIRDFPESPWSDRVVHDFSIVEQDPDVQVVVETIGGARIAYEYTKRALLAGKNVVTSNKELVATHGAELLHLARERNLNYLFEASVGGGIPIIRPINQCLAANEISSIYGILNGTTNYILTKMEKAGTSLQETLHQAQTLGYAEADPTADLQGDDACRKICILASLAFGKQIYPQYVSAEGICEITGEDIAIARKAGYAIKLLGRAQRLEDGRVCAFVAPHLVPEESPLHSVEDVFNAIIVSGDAIGDVMFYGRGAGKMPTASAVVADVIDAVKHFRARKYVYWEDGGPEDVASPGDLPSRWYVCSSGAKLPELHGQALWSPEGVQAVLTQPLTGPQLRTLLAKLPEGTRSIRVL